MKDESTDNGLKAFKVGKILGLKYSLEMLENIMKIFNGYPKNKITALDVKEQIESVMTIIKDSIKRDEEKL